MKQSILVLGSDFIARSVVQGLAATDWALPLSAADVTSKSAALQGIAGVVNCTSGSPAVIVESTRALFRKAGVAASPMPIVHLGSMSVYGSAVGRVDESSAVRDDIGAYAAAHIAAETIAAAYPRCVIFRLGCEFGPGSDYWSGRIAQCLLAGRLGDLGSAGDGYCNLLDVDDLVQAVIRALTSARVERGIFNLCNPEAPTWNEFLTRYAIALHAVPVRRISHRRLRLEAKILAPPLKAAEILFRACRIDARRLPPPIPPSLLRVMRQEIRLDTRRIEADLEVRWKDLNTTLRETAQWFLH